MKKTNGFVFFFFDLASIYMISTAVWIGDFNGWSYANLAALILVVMGMFVHGCSVSIMSNEDLVEKLLEEAKATFPEE